MKRKLATMVLAVASMVGSAGLAQAQPAPPPPPPGPPPAMPPAPPPPPPAEFGVAPAALPAAPVQAAPPPVVSFGNAPPGDTTSPEAKPEKKPNPFRFTRFTWGNNASTKIFGVGKDYIGTEDSQYTMDFSLGLRYYVVDKPLDTVYVGATLGWNTELTNADSTTYKREVFFKDLSLGAGYGHTVYQSADKETKTTPIASASVALPTSKFSRDQGKYLTTNLTVGAVQALSLAGSKSDWFADVLGFATLTWSHLFSNGTTPTNGIIDTRPRQTAPSGACDKASGDCAGASSDQLAGGAFAHDTARFNFTYFLSIYKDLSFGNTWGVDIPTKYTFRPGAGVGAGCDFSTPTTPCGKAGHAVNDRTNGIPVTTFDVSFSYLIYDTVRLDLGYVNSTGQLGEDGKRRSMFYSPDAQFYGNVAIYIDNILERVTTPKQATRTAANGFGFISR